MKLPGSMENGIIGMTFLEVALEESLPGSTRSSLDTQECSFKNHAFKAITRGVSRSIAACELTYRSREHIDYEKAASPYAGSIDTFDISEFRKAEGSLSCLSLIYKEPLQDQNGTNMGGVGDGKPR